MRAVVFMNKIAITFVILFSLRSRQRERLHAMGLSVCLSACLSVCLFCLSVSRQNAIRT